MTLRSKTLQVVETIAIGSAGGALFYWAQLPGGLITGAMIAVGAAGLAGRKMGLPPPLSHIVLMALGVSLGSDTDMVFSKPQELGGDAITVRLPRRSMFQLSDDFRFVYRHSIPMITETRWSMTFRTLTPEGEALRASFAQ